MALPRLPSKVVDQYSKCKESDKLCVNARNILLHQTNPKKMDLYIEERNENLDALITLLDHYENKYSVIKDTLSEIVQLMEKNKENMNEALAFHIVMEAVSKLIDMVPDQKQQKLSEQPEPAKKELPVEEKEQKFEVISPRLAGVDYYPVFPRDIDLGYRYKPYNRDEPDSRQAFFKKKSLIVDSGLLPPLEMNHKLFKELFTQRILPKEPITPKVGR